MVVIGLLAGLALLFFGGDWLVTGSSRIARSMGVSALVVGLTIVAIGTSMPELLVSLSAALAGSADISLGNVVGSNIANIGLILGVAGLIYPISVHVQLLRREIPIMLVVAVAAYLMLLDGLVSRVDGLLLIAGMFAFLAFMVVSSLREQKTQHNIPEDKDVLPDKVNRWWELGRLTLGIILLMVGAQLTVDNAVLMAESIGISERIIGVTLVAVGTSLPELVTSVTAAFRKESDIAIGNVVGSNIFNVLGILGATAIIQPVNAAPQIIQVDAPIMVAFSILVFPFAWNRILGRGESFAFLLAYGAFIILTISAS